MEKQDYIVLGLAGVAVLLVLKAGGVLSTPAAMWRQYQSGLSYDPGPGYGDTSKYTDYADTAVSNGGWGIE